MQIYSLLASIFTVISCAMFAAIVLWAYSGRRKSAFDAAANEPFALPDERDRAQRGIQYEARR